MLGKTFLFLGAILSGLVLQNADGIFRTEAAKSDASAVAAYVSHISVAAAVPTPAKPLPKAAGSVGQVPTSATIAEPSSQSFKQSAAESLKLAELPPTVQEVAKRPPTATPETPNKAPGGCQDGVCPTSRGSGRWRRWRS